MPRSPLWSNHRLCFAFSLATVLHGALIFSIDLMHTEITQRDSRLEIALTQGKSLDKPKRESSHDQADQHRTNNEERNDIRKNLPKPAMEESVPRQMKLPSLNTSITDAHEQEKIFDTQALTMMKMDDSFGLPSENYTVTSKVRILSNLSSITNAESFYLASWHRKIQNIGKLNYPQAARERKLYGSLRLMVTVLQDGSLKKVEVIESSGHQILDHAAIDIVTLSSPFAPFPDDLRQSSNELRIIRTWQFKKNSAFQSF